jgi:hypothetical protein
MKSSRPDPGPETKISPTVQVIGQVYDNSYFIVPIDPESITEITTDPLAEPYTKLSDKIER